MQKLWVVFLCLFVVSFAVVTGCGGSRWQVLKQADPSLISGSSKFFLEKPTFDGVTVGGKTEESFQAGREESQKASWEADKSAFGDEYTNSYGVAKEPVLAASAPGEGFVVKSHVTWIEPGFYSAAASRPTEVKMSVQIVDPQGGVLDEILVRTSVPLSLSTPTTGAGLREAGKDLGKSVASYVKRRTGQD